MYKILLSFVFILSFSAKAADHQSELSQCRKNCDPESCAHYSLEKALQCIEECEKDKTLHGEIVVEQCHKRMEQLMTHEQQKVTFPDACGNATKWGALENLVPLEGVIVHSAGQWKLEAFGVESKSIGEKRHHAAMVQYAISPNVGEIGTGKPHGDVNLLSRTPEGHVVTAHVDLDKKTVMCLSPAYKP